MTFCPAFTILKFNKNLMRQAKDTLTSSPHLYLVDSRRRRFSSRVKRLEIIKVGRICYVSAIFCALGHGPENAQTYVDLCEATIFIVHSVRLCWSLLVGLENIQIIPFSYVRKPI